MTKFDFYITYLCNSNCKFCCVRDKLVWFQQKRKRAMLTYDEVKQILVKKRKDGFDYVTFTGGEPTIHSDFLKIMALSKKLGFRTSVNSNMSAMSDPEFCKEALQYTDEMVASIHGHTPKVHNALTGTKKGFQEFIQAMDNLEKSKKDIYLITDTVILTENLNHLVDIIHLVTGYKKVKHILFSNVNLPPDGVETLKHLVVPLPEIRKILPVVHNEVVVKKGLILRYYGLPFCILGDYQAQSADLFFDPKKVIERSLEDNGMTDKERDVRKPTMAKIQGEKCRECIYHEVCGGYFRSYHAIYKDSHIKPVLKKTIP